MSKRDKHNRFAQEDTLEDTVIDFQEVVSEDGDSVSIGTSAAAGVAPRTVSINIDTGNDSEDTAGLFSKLGTLLSSICGKTKSVAGSCFGVCGRWTKTAWSGIIPLCRKLASYCVISWNTDDDEEAESGEVTANVGTRTAASKVAVSKTENKTETKADWEDIFDEESPRYSWLGHGWKYKVLAASVAAAVLLTGAVFGYRSFFTSTPDTVDVAVNADSELPNAAEVKPEPTPPMIVAETQTPEPKPELKPKQAKVEQIVDIPAALVPPLATAAQTPAAVDDDPFAAISTAPTAVEASFADILGDTPAEEPKTTAITTEAEEVAKAPKEKINTPKEDVENPLATAKDTPKREKKKRGDAATLKPLQSMESEPTVAGLRPKRSQLAPLQALKSEQAPDFLTAQSPVAAVSSVHDKTASNFAEKPNIPEKSTPIAAKKSDGIRPPVVAAPLKEITPKIPAGDQIQAVKPQPKMTKPQPQVAVNEDVPVIPKDRVASGELTAFVEKPNGTSAAADTNAVVNTPLTQPLGTQLKEHVNDLRNNVADIDVADSMASAVNGTQEPAELTLRFTPLEGQKIAADQAAAEPALRFTPKKNVLSQEAPQATAPTAIPLLDMKEMETLLPSSTPSVGNGTLAVVDTANAASGLPPLQDAPTAVFANINPAYRNAEKSVTAPSVRGQVVEGGKTFKKRIKELIARSPDTVQEYIVKPGDTYLTISDRFYGTSLLYTALAAHNRKLNVGWQPEAGTKIEVPTADYLQTNYANAINRQERRLNDQPSAQGIKYVVQDGDTLLGLAMEKLHNSSRWHEILAMNPDCLSDPRDLRPGMEILIPAETVHQSWASRR